MNRTNDVGAVSIENINNLLKLCQRDNNMLVDIDPNETWFGNTDNNNSNSINKDLVSPIPRSSILKFNYPPYNLDNIGIIKKKDSFIIYSLNTQYLREDNKLDSYDRIKYGLLYDYIKFKIDVTLETLQSLDKDKDWIEYLASIYSDFLENKIPQVWLELLCIDKDSRGKLISHYLLDTLKKKIRNTYHKNNYIIIGIDIAGTIKDFKNKSLRQYYQKLGFHFPKTGFEHTSGGAQLGYLIINQDIPF